MVCTQAYLKSLEMYEHLFRKLRITVALEKANMAQYGSTHWLFGVESLSTGNYGNTHHTFNWKNQWLPDRYIPFGHPESVSPGDQSETVTLTIGSKTLLPL